MSARRAPPSSLTLPVDVILQRIAFWSTHAELIALVRTSRLAYEAVIPVLYRSFCPKEDLDIANDASRPRAISALRHTVLLDMRYLSLPLPAAFQPLPRVHTIILDLKTYQSLAVSLACGRPRTQVEADTLIFDTYFPFDTPLTPLILSIRPRLNDILDVFPRAQHLILLLSPLNLGDAPRSQLLDDIDARLKSITMVFVPSRGARYWYPSSNTSGQTAKPRILSDTLAYYVSKWEAETAIVGVENVHPTLRPDHGSPLDSDLEIISAFKYRVQEVIQQDTERVFHGPTGREKGPKDSRVEVTPGRRLRLRSMRHFVDEDLDADQRAVLRLGLACQK